ncbi:MAG: GIY-YIG nuclease family protein [Patescibacteria group bacterium]
MRSGTVMFYTYILQLDNNSFYIGYSSNLKQRHEYHKSGRVKTTKNSKKIKLVFYAAFDKKSLAISFEKYLKSSSGFAFRNKHLI